MSKSKDLILKLIKKNKSTTSSLLTKKLDLSRQTIAKHLKALVESGDIVKTGSTKSATYSFYKNKKNTHSSAINFVKTLKGLEEHVTYKELELRMSLNKYLNKNAQSIAFYAFGEMLNNAIDHSKSKKVNISADIKNGSFEFRIKDQGIGAFHNIKEYYGLDSELDSVNWLLSGKKTTMPDRHSGEGLFFTSKISDHFSLKSHKLIIKFNNSKKDISLEDVQNINGTEVFFSIKNQTKKKLAHVFQEYTNSEFTFDKSKSTVKLNSKEASLSRSQARKILASLGEFERIQLDLKGMKEIGQAFCDEIFRVYKLRHPKKVISWINASPAVEFMIQRSLREK